METDGVSQLTQSLGRYYVRYFNQTHRRTGTLWEGRYKSSLVDSELYFFIVSRYIELNPVRAFMVEKPKEYNWSSDRKNAIGKQIELIIPHESYLSLGKNDKEREAAYRLLFEEPISDNKLQEIRDSINKAWVLGGK
jgi:putative transposase